MYDFNDERKLAAVERDFGAVPLGFGAKLKLWHDFYLIRDEVPVITYVDPRIKNGLTALGRQFVFSMMYHNLRLGDFSEARFEIFRFPKAGNSDDRFVRIYEFDEAEILDFGDLNAAVDETYQLWMEVLAEREAEARPKKTGTDDQYGFGL